MALRDPVRQYGFTGAGFVLLLTGLVLVKLNGATRPRAGTSFGWFSYAPLDQQYADYLPGPRSGVDWWTVGLGLAAVGLIVAAGGIGYRLGRRVPAPGLDRQPGRTEGDPGEEGSGTVPRNR